MMGKIFCFLFVAALLFGGLGGRMGEVAAALPQGAGRAGQLVLSIAGTICVWSGVMEVMDQSGLTKKISRALSPVIKALFGRQGQDPEARDALSQNMAANLLGLGSAATPAGLRAAARLAQTGGRPDCDGVLRLIVLNSASLQLIPANVAAVRAAAGSAHPFAILPAVWMASAASVCAALLAAALLARVWRP